MRFEPQTEDQIKQEEAKRLPLVPGIYDCEVAQAEDAISKAGNDMIALTLRVYGEDGGTRTVRDWLVATLPGKVKRAAEGFGLAQQYDMGVLQAADFQGRPGKVRVRIERDAAGKYPDKNVVAEYPPVGSVPRDPMPRETQAAPPRVSQMVNDDIPF